MIHVPDNAIATEVPPQIPIHRIKQWVLLDDCESDKKIPEYLPNIIQSIPRIPDSVTGLNICEAEDSDSVIKQIKQHHTFNQCVVLSMRTSFKLSVPKESIFNRKQCFKSLQCLNLKIKQAHPPWCGWGGDAGHSRTVKDVRTNILTRINDMLQYLCPSLMCLQLRITLVYPDEDGEALGMGHGYNKGYFGVREDQMDLNENILKVPENVEWLRVTMRGDDKMKIDVSECDKLVGIGLGGMDLYDIIYNQKYVIPIAYLQEWCYHDSPVNIRFLSFDSDEWNVEDTVNIDEVMTKLNYDMQNKTDDSFLCQNVNGKKLRYGKIFDVLMKHVFINENTRKNKLLQYKTWWLHDIADWIKRGTWYNWD